MSALGDLLRSKIAGEVLDQPFDLGRYATDASIYQVLPKAIAVPARPEDIDEILRLARTQGVAVLPRGGGTSQAGQTVNDAIVVDTSVHLNKLLAVDPAGQSCRVQPGIVLDELNRQLAPHGLWFPVDISTASRATIGGMTANNSCGARSLHYGIMRHNVSGIDAIMADGTHARFSSAAAEQNVPDKLVDALTRIGQREQQEIVSRMPDLLRRVGGYNLDVLVPDAHQPNLAELLVGSEGTLAYFNTIDLKLAPVLGTRALGVCHFPTFAEAMAATEHLVALKPLGVELVDATMLDLARKIPLFEPIIEKFTIGRPAALLLVEFLAETADALVAKGARVFATSDKVKSAQRLDHIRTDHWLTDPIAAIVSFYGMVERIAVSRGINPDTPRHLNKVTETV